MPAPTVSVSALSTDPGYLYWAPLGTAEPTHTVGGSIFTDAWAAAWIYLGPTEEGNSFSFSTATEPIEVAELLDPVKYVETGRSGAITFALANITSQNIKRVNNGGVLTTTGLTATTMTTYTPPTLGASVRCMIGWEAQDFTERLVCYQTFQTGTMELARRKGAAKATLPATFSLEVPASGTPFKHIAAGVNRTGT